MDDATIIMGAFALFLFGIVIVGTIFRTRWGLNFGRPHCPNCGTQVPRFRRPTSGSQAAWGGWTCETCGTGMDKWGRQISGPTKEFKAAGLNERE